MVASEQQLVEMQEWLNQAELEKNKLVSELSQAQAQIVAQDKRQAITDQRLLDIESRNQELEKSYREAALAHSGHERRRS